MNDRDKEFLQELIMMTVSSILFLLIYYFQTLPEWKRDLLIQEILHRVRHPRRGDKFKTEVQEFRKEISSWEHSQRARNTGIEDE